MDLFEIKFVNEIIILTSRYWKSENEGIYLLHTFKKMRNLKKQVLCLLMLIPMLVLLAHDVIPHNHRLHNANEDQQISVIHVHQYVESNSCTHHHHGEKNWNHQHKTNAETCCILTHNRVQKEIKYQIFLKADIIQLDSEDIQKVKIFRIRNYILIPEPLQFSPLKRGPPRLNLA